MDYSESDRINDYQKAKAAKSRDIGSPREVYDDERRAAADESLRCFLESYFPQAFPLDWSEDHLKVIDVIQQVASTSGTFALAMPRGSGKTTIAIRAAMWALLTGRRRYVVVCASTERAAKGIVKAIRSELSVNEQLRLDYPNELHGIWQLKGDNRRAGGQLCHGEKTMVSLGTTEIVFPTHKYTKIGGSVVYAAGLTGSVRGLFHTRLDGQVIRPDFVILDDPQTKESAESVAQTQERCEIIDGDVMGLAGPGNTIAAVMPCTVIAKDDLADRYLGNNRWQSMRAKMLYSFPENLKIWDEYFERRSEEIRTTGGHADADAFYLDHREEMDAGAVPGWPERKKENEISAIQSAMHLWYRSPSAFAAQYQNEPLQESASTDLPSFEGLEAKLTRLDSGVAPVWATKITCGIDVQKRMLFYVVAAWDDEFTGTVIEYGAFPEQGRTYYTYAEASPTLQSKSGATQYEPALRWGLDSLTNWLMGRVFSKEGSGELRIRQILIDANYGESTNTVYEFCRRSPHANAIYPSHGRSVKASDKPFRQYEQRPGMTIGFDWLLTPGDGRRNISHILVDVNSWKTFLAARSKAMAGERGSLSLFGTRQEQHRMFMDHLKAEFPTHTYGRGRDLYEWKARPGADNHWLDCLILSAVGASIQGSKFSTFEPVKRAARRKIAANYLTF